MTKRPEAPPPGQIVAGRPTPKRPEPDLIYAGNRRGGLDIMEWFTIIYVIAAIIGVAILIVTNGCI